MITAEGCQQRRRRLWASLADKPDFILIAEPQHLVYLANYFPSPYVFRTANSQAVLILGQDGSSTLVADSMVQPFAEEAFVDEIVTPVWYDGQHSAPIRSELLADSVVDRLQKMPGVRIGVESSGVAASVVERLREQRGTAPAHHAQSLVAPAQTEQRSRRAGSYSTGDSRQRCR